jgi:hypothetical protein
VGTRGQMAAHSYSRRPNYTPLWQSWALDLGPGYSADPSYCCHGLACETRHTSGLSGQVTYTVLGGSEMFFLSAGTASTVVSAYLKVGGVVLTGLKTGILGALACQRSAC